VIRGVGRSIVAAVLGGLLTVTPAAATSPAFAPRTPIQHAVFLMEENHTFDNLFGTYAAGDGIPADACMPVNPGKQAAGCVKPQFIGDQAVQDLSHTRGTFAAQFDKGKMDGFVQAQTQAGANGSLAMGYYDERNVPFSWNVADQFVLFDRFFSSANGGTVWNHMFWVTGAAGSELDAIPSEGFGDLPTIFDRLQAAGVTWKFYVQNYDPTVTFRNAAGIATQSSQVERVPLLAYARYLDDPALLSHVVDVSQYYRDLNAGTLPSVAYIVPSGVGEHSPGSVRAAEQFAGSLINALTRSSAWPTSSFLWTYDDWGGWYDHVSPPQVDRFGYGFRVPALLIGPYARKGYVDHTVLDFASIVRFITDNWGLEPLAARDAAAQTFMGAFDFANTARPPVFVAASRDVETLRHEPQRPIIFLTYGAALALALALILFAAVRSRDQGSARERTK
jgi:phospholipase C